MQSAVSPVASASARSPGDRLRLALLLAGLVGLGATGAPLAGEVTPADERAQEGAGWEFRRLAAQLLWAKTHAVLHAGVEERAALPGEAATRPEYHRHGEGGGRAAHGEEAEEGHRHDEHCGHDTAGEEGEGEAGHVLVIPPAAEDFRGPLGHLERAVKPYLGPGGRMYEKDAAQTLPFYRLMTWADPHFIPAWTVGATFVADGGRRADEGLAFLHEGERANPDSWEIQAELGHFYLVYRRDHARAERHLTAALRRLPADAADLDEEARVEAYRWLALCYVVAGKPDAAVRTAREGQRFAPGDVTFAHVLRFRGRNWTAEDLRRPAPAGGS